MPWGAAIAAGGAIIGSSMQADAAEDAAAAQGQASAASIGEQRRQYDTARRDSAPYRQVGASAVTRIGDLLGLRGAGGVGTSGGDWKSAMKQAYSESFPQGGNPGVLTALYDIIDKSKSPDDASVYGESPMAFAQRTGIPTPGGLGDVIQMASQPQAPVEQNTGAAAEDFGSLNRKFTVGDFYNDPVTQLSMKYGLDLGAKGINQGAAAGGMLRSGQTLKALTEYGTDYAGTKAGESYQRFFADQDRVFNRLAGVSGVGQTAQANTASLGAQTGANIGNTLTAQGNARGAAAIAGSNAWNQGMNTVGSWWNQEQNRKQQQQYLDRRFPQQSSSSNTYGFNTNYYAED